MLLTSTYNLAASLGAIVDSRRAIPEKLVEAPSCVQQYYSTIIWPGGFRYEGPTECELASVRLADTVAPMPNDYEVPGSTGMRLYCIGMADEDSALLFVDGNDDKPQDPMIYVFHRGDAAGLREACPLNTFLKHLVAANPQSDSELFKVADQVFEPAWRSR